jgi:phosphoribosylformimino-5-aminoimidazole carboxamide ribotide isomerase
MALQPIPAIDLKDGGCVRLYQGRFDRLSAYPLRPEALIERYVGLGVECIHVVDLDGARDGVSGNRDLIARMAALAGGRIQVGGGLRDRADVEACLALGAARAVIGSAAAERADEVRGWLADFGAERIVLAFDLQLDADGTPRLRTRGWTRDAGLSLWDAVACFAGAGLKHLLCTDIERDGAMTGPNLELYTELAARYPGMAIQASGGTRHGADLQALRGTGASGAVIGRALLEGGITGEEIRRFLQNG